MEDLKQLARNIFTQALADCSIPRAFDRTLRIENNQLLIDGEPPIHLDRLKRIHIVAAGKAAAPMLAALLARLPLPPTCSFAGVLIAPKRPQNLPTSIDFFPGGHPSPNEASFDGASAALATMQDAARFPADETLCLFLISGGASSMMELPLDPFISLANTIAFHQALVLSGASIVEINCVRKHFSAVKGGRLALAAGLARKLSFLVSDVPPAHLDALASGPTLPDPTTVDDCRDILARYSLLERFPTPVRRFFEAPTLPETPKPSAHSSPFRTLLDSTALAAAAQTRAAALGFHSIIDNTCDDWPFHRAADYLLNRLRSLRRDHPRCCLISTGEVSVPVSIFERSAPHFEESAPIFEKSAAHLNDSSPHLGGRNQHLALYLVTQLRPDDGPIAVLSAGSDGIDGNSAAAGAVIDEHTIGNNHASAQTALAAFDSSTWLSAANATILAGPTGHNLRDLRILLADAAN